MRIGPHCVAILLVAACGDAGSTETAAPPTTTSTTMHVTSTTDGLPPTTTPATTTTLAPLPELSPSQPSVWYGPNMGSVDLPELFTHPELWPSARSSVDVLQFYGNAVSGFPYDIGGDNVLSTFVDVAAFQKLLDWNIAIAVEAGAIKFFECSPDPWAEYAITGIDNVEANGGRVSFVSMDEPLIGGQIVENGLTCDLSMAETAEVVADFVNQVTAAHPNVLVGDVEAYPHYPVADLEEWILALEAAGYSPAYFHLDVDIERAAAEGQDVIADLRRIRDFTEEREIPFGVILTANWTSTDTDERYYQSTIQWTETVKSALDRPTHVILQSWWGPAESGLHEVPVNLPEDDPEVFSHTRLILDVLGLLSND